MEAIKNFWTDEEGLEFSEYALMLALIAIAIIASITLLKDAIANKFSDAATNIESS